MESVINKYTYSDLEKALSVIHSTCKEYTGCIRCPLCIKIEAPQFSSICDNLVCLLDTSPLMWDAETVIEMAKEKEERIRVESQDDDE